MMIDLSVSLAMILQVLFCAEPETFVSKRKFNSKS